MDDRVYAQRTDESSLYTVTQADLALLPAASWQLRERRLWQFDENDVARIVIHQDGRTRAIVRNGVNRWSLAPGSQGIINDLALDEVAHQLGGLAAESWIAQGDDAPARYGFTTNSLRVEVELKTGRKLDVDFGATAPSGTTFALVQLDDHPWIFEISWRLFHQFIQPYLTIPAAPR